MFYRSPKIKNYYFSNENPQFWAIEYIETAKWSVYFPFQNNKNCINCEYTGHLAPGTGAYHFNEYFYRKSINLWSSLFWRKKKWNRLTSSFFDASFVYFAFSASYFLKTENRNMIRFSEQLFSSFFLCLDVLCLMTTCGEVSMLNIWPFRKRNDEHYAKSNSSFRFYFIFLWGKLKKFCEWNARLRYFIQCQKY